MLKAIDADSATAVYGWDAVRGHAYICPECKTPVVPKKGAKVIHHFAHRGDSACVFGRGESIRHMTLKRQMGNYLMTACTAVVSVEYEVRLIPGHVADLVLGLHHGVYRSRMVVECQVSPIDPYEWRRRTADYARNGIPVMWVWDARRIPLKTAVHDVTDVEIHEARVPQEILYAAGCGHTLYVADAVGTLRLLRLQEVFRECSMCDGVGTTEWGDCEYCGGEGGRDLKMTKEVDQFGMPRQFGAFEEHRFTNLRFAHIDLRTAVDEERPDWLSLLTRVQVEPESGTP